MDSPGIKLVFLGTHRPALHSATDFLLDQFSSGSTTDMSSATVVVPSARAERQLKRRLLQTSDEMGTSLFPPRMVTVGRLPELLYQPDRTLADDLTQRLAWAKAVKETDEDTLARIGVAANPPAGEQPRDEIHWVEIGTLLWSQYKELASENLSFADVAEKGAGLAGFTDLDRWNALGVLQEAYHRILASLDKADRFTSRLEAMRRKECRFEGELFLFGTVDLTSTVRGMLTQVAAYVTALVHAPDEWSQRFDQFGCLCVTEWQSCNIAISEDQWRVADGPLDQTHEVINCLREFGADYLTADISIGLPDESLAPLLQRTFSACDLPARWGPGRRVGETAPIKLLSAVASLLEGNQYRDFAALIRHPDVNRWLESESLDFDYLTLVDAQCQKRLPVDYAEIVPNQRRRPDDHLVAEVTAKVEELLKPLVGPPRPLNEWSQPIAKLLSTIYASELDPNKVGDALVIRGCDEIRQVLISQRQVSAAVAPRLSAADVLRQLVRDASNVNVGAPTVAGGIELLGWLELPLDDAPVLVLTSFNEEFVPSTIDADLFLPNALRIALEIDSNSRRYARDAYALSILLATRREMRLVVARRDAHDDPLLPSRLLFVADPETIANRWTKILSAHVNEEPVRSPGLIETVPKESQLPIPLPDANVQFTRALSPTDFKSYLACPYRFYLERVLRLKTVEDEIMEMDAGLFGTITHDALKCFGDGKYASADDEKAIESALNICLNQVVQQQFGRSVAPAVALQIEQIRMRLNAFAPHQAQWRAKGWQIKYTEVPRDNEEITFEVDGELTTLAGRIDRIDFHAATGRWAIWDYKTSDSAKTPRQAHNPGKGSVEWADLQLPIYRHLASCLEDVKGDVQLGYILLPRDTKKVQFVEADWTPEELHVADEAARDVIRKIRAGIFWEPTDPPPPFSNALASICRDGVLEQLEVRAE